MFTFGADPEIFVTQKGKPVSAHGLVPGTKESPLKTAVGAVQVDGMALEFNIDPAAAFEQFNQNIVRTIQDLKEMVPGYSFNLSPVQEFPQEYIDAQPEEAKELGCDPDYCAYTMKPNPRPDGTRNFRTGAGHLHIGWGAGIPIDNAEHMEICAQFVKYLDATVGMFMTFIDRDPRRRELYGKAGAFRPKPYGVEYRTPSNVWLKNKDRRLLIWHMMNKAIDWNTRNFELFRLSDGFSFDEAARIINEGDWQKAQTLITHMLRFNGGSVDRAWQKIQSETFELN